MLKKITTPANNRCECVELILRGAKKRRTLAYANANTINSDAGIKANLSAEKRDINKAGNIAGIFILCTEF